MKIIRYYKDKNGKKTNIKGYDLNTRSIDCADSFTKYKNSSKDNNFNRLEITDINSIEKDLPKVYFILKKLKCKFENENIIKGNKNFLIYCFRIIRYKHKHFGNRLSIMYNILKNNNISVYNTLFIADFIDYYINKSCFSYSTVRNLNMVISKLKIPNFFPSQRNNNIIYVINNKKNIDQLLKSKNIVFTSNNVKSIYSKHYFKVTKKNIDKIKKLYIDYNIIFDKKLKEKNYLSFLYHYKEFSKKVLELK